MKKIARLMTVLAMIAFTCTSCEDVPSPFGQVTPPDPKEEGNTKLPYTSTNLKTGWTLQEVTEEQPWSQGSSYVQATGYQDWDNTGTKSNRPVEGWLVSPAFSTKDFSKVKFSFDQTIKYTNNVSGWEANHKVYVCNNYDENNFEAATWVEITDYKPVASPYSDWTLYSSGEMQLPESMVNQEAIRFGFWFKAPATASTTWELKNFNIQEGTAEKKKEEGGGDTPSGNLGTADAPITVAQALAIINGYSDKQTSASDAYVKGKIAAISEKEPPGNSYGNATYEISDDGTTTATLTIFRGLNLGNKNFTSANDIKVGDEVVVTGKLTKYYTTPEMAQGNYIYSLNGKTAEGDSPKPSTGTVYSIDFTKGVGEWTISDKTKPAEIANIWVNSSQYGMKATAFANSKDYDSESWLISPSFSLSGRTAATLKISHAVNYFTSIDVAKTQAVVMVSSDGTNWTDLTLSSWPEKLSWTFVDATADLSAFAGKSSVQLALKYISTSAKAGTWEVKTLSVE